MKKIISIVFNTLAISTFIFAKPQKSQAPLAEENYIEMEAKDFSFEKADKEGWKGVILKNSSLDIIEGTSKKAACIVKNINYDWRNGNQLVLFETDSENNLPLWLIEDFATNAPVYTIKINLHRKSKNGAKVANFLLDSNSFDTSTSYSPEVIKFEGPTYTELQEQKAEKERKELEEKQKKYAVLNEKAAVYAIGLQYHGKEEEENNYKAFKYGTMEAGHAYYIANYTPNQRYYDTMGSVIYSYFEGTKDKYIKFKDNKVKQDLLEASDTGLGGFQPVDVVMTGSSSGTPVIIGVIK